MTPTLLAEPFSFKEGRVPERNWIFCNGAKTRTRKQKTRHDETRNRPRPPKAENTERTIPAFHRNLRREARRQQVPLHRHAHWGARLCSASPAQLAIKNLQARPSCVKRLRSAPVLPLDQLLLVLRRARDFPDKIWHLPDQIPELPGTGRQTPETSGCCKTWPGSSRPNLETLQHPVRKLADLARELSAGIRELPKLNRGPKN